MPKKLTIEYVKEKFQERGFELLEDEYINASIKMKYRCPNNHINSISWKHFRQGHGCPTCSGNKKLTYKEVKMAFSERNYKLLSTEYRNAHEKLLYECPNGHINSITWGHFQQGQGCPDCSGIKKLTYELVEQKFRERGFQLLSTEYIGYHQKLSYKCPNGHINEILWRNFQQGHGCPICGSQRALEAMRKNGTFPTSKQQLYLHQLLGGELNYLIENLSLDIAFIDERIYLEYDGSGHWLQVEYGQLTQEEFNEKEKKRFLYLKSQEWREIRIISKQDKLPSDEKILELVQFAKDYLNTGHSWIHIDIDNSEIKCSQFTKKVDLGELRKIY